MIRVEIRAQPAARKESVEVAEDGAISVRVRAPAIDGRANHAVIVVLAEALGLKARQVRILRGERSRTKLVEIELDTESELMKRLAARSGNR